MLLITLQLFTYPNTCESRSEACNCALVSHVRGGIREDILHRVYFLESWILEQAEPSNSENGVEDVDHVSRTVC
jgi:hypothetical protein